MRALDPKLTELVLTGVAFRELCRRDRERGGARDAPSVHVSGRGEAAAVATGAVGIEELMPMVRVLARMKPDDKVPVCASGGGGGGGVVLFWQHPCHAPVACLECRPVPKENFLHSSRPK